MTDKLIMTTEQRDNYLQIMRNNMQDPDAYDAVAELQSLPMVDSEPPRGVPNLEDFAKQLCTEHGTLDIYETVYRDQGNSYTPYSGQPAWSTYVLDAEYALNAYEKCSKLYTSPQAPVLVDSEPVAYMLEYQEYCDLIPADELPDHLGMMNARDGKTTPLYTSPQALTPITADDVTDEMIDMFTVESAKHEPDRFGEDKAWIAAAYNAVINHRSETK